MIHPSQAKWKGKPIIHMEQMELIYAFCELLQAFGKASVGTEVLDFSKEGTLTMAQDGRLFVSETGQALKAAKMVGPQNVEIFTSDMRASFRPDSDGRAFTHTPALKIKGYRAEITVPAIIKNN